MAKLRDEFSRKQWKDCCGKGCKKCDIAQAYRDRYGRAEGLKKLNADRDAIRKISKKDGGKAKRKIKA